MLSHLRPLTLLGSIIADRPIEAHFPTHFEMGGSLVILKILLILLFGPRLSLVLIKCLELSILDGVCTLRPEFKMMAL